MHISRYDFYECFGNKLSWISLTEKAEEKCPENVLPEKDIKI